MNSRLRSAILATAALAGAVLAASSLQARDAAGGQPSGADRWRLRPADVATTGSTVPSAPDRPSTRERPAFEIPQERRAVRVVYPGLLADR